MNPKSLPCLMAMLFISTLSFAQNCTYDVNEVDEFTKAKKVFSPYQTVYSIQKTSDVSALSFRIAQIDSSYFLVVMYNYLAKGVSGHKTYCLNSECRLMIKTASDSIVTFNYTGDVDCADSKLNSSEYGSSVDYTAIGFYPITPLQFDYLATQTIAKVRMYFTDFYEDIEIPSQVKKPFIARYFRGTDGFTANKYFSQVRKCFK